MAENGAARSDVDIQIPLRLRGEGGGANRGRKLLYTLAASILVMVVSGWIYLQRGVFTTDIGEQRSLVLTDGSTVEINSRSRLKVQYTGQERRVDLLEGQALFHVAKNKTRPFIVQTGNTRIRAVGTAFDVYKTSSGTVVTVVEGRIAVHNKPDTKNSSMPAREAATDRLNNRLNPPLATRVQAGAEEILLDAGEQLVVPRGAIASSKRANIASATAWTRRSLVFDSSPLTEVAQEYNRYNTRQLVIESPQLANFHISGVFSSVEPTLFLRFLHAQPELIVQETDAEIRIRQK